MEARRIEDVHLFKSEQIAQKLEVRTSIDLYYSAVLGKSITNKSQPRASM